MCQAIIYVVDSSDVERIGISRDEFHAILDEEELKDSLILVYANKQVSTRKILSQRSDNGWARKCLVKVCALSCPSWCASCAVRRTAGKLW